MSGNPLKRYHHVTIGKPFILDAEVWTTFLSNETPIRRLCRPFVDWENEVSAINLNFYMGASRNFSLGMGGIFGNHWFSERWPVDFIQNQQPSIEFLE